MKYVSYLLKQSGRECLQPLALFAQWPFLNGIQFGDRLMAVIDTTDDLAALITSGKDFDLREEKELDYLTQEKSHMMAQANRLRTEAGNIDSQVTNVIEPRILAAAKAIAI